MWTMNALDAKSWQVNLASFTATYNNRYTINLFVHFPPPSLLPPFLFLQKMKQV
jgi:hypothetical protein